MGALLHTGRAAAAGAGDGEARRKWIAEYYDEACGECEGRWGDHMHQGLYEPGVTPSAAPAYHRAAQIRAIEEALRFAGVSDDPLKRPKSIVDVGCGIGGSSRYLAKRYGAKCIGFTISPVEAERAQALTAVEDFADRVSFQVADAMDQPFPDGQFDLVWAMSSAEHMPDKRKFVSELARVAAPGGTIVIVSWVHRDLLPSEDSLRPDELSFLNRMGDAFYAPVWCSTVDYVKIAQSLSLQDINSADWSEYVAPYCRPKPRSAYTWQFFMSLIGGGWKATRGVLASSLMSEGFNKGLVKYAIVTCRKPGLVSEK